MTTNSSVVHIGWTGEIGGAERAVHQLAAAQRATTPRRVALAFGQATGWYAELARSTGIPVIDLHMRSGSDVRSAIRARRALSDFDIHHFHAAEPLLMMASASCPAAIRIYTHRAGAVSYGRRAAARYRLVAPIVRRFDVITGTAQAAAGAERWLNVPASQVVRTFNGLDFALLDDDLHLSREQLRREHGVPPDAVLIGTAANLRRWKRIDWLIEASERMRSDNWLIWIVGDGDDRQRLEQLTLRSSTRDRIRFHGMQTAVGQWLKALDVFVLPSGPEESFGNAVIEAMACGLPPIVSRDCPAHVEHVADEQTGLLVADPDELAIALDDLVSDGAKRARIGAAARRFVRSAYPVDRMVARFESIYGSLELRRS